MGVLILMREESHLTTSKEACVPLKSNSPATPNLKDHSLNYGPKVSLKPLSTLDFDYLTVSILETKKAKATPAPNNYKQEDHATKLARFDNIHLGTDKKTTAKDIKLTPGPGHYQRVDE